MARYICERDVYNLIEPRGAAIVHCSQIDELPRFEVVACRGAKLERKEYFDRYEGLENHIKKAIAVDLGKYLLEKGLISFTQTEKTDEIIKIEGEITVIRENKSGECKAETEVDKIPYRPLMWDERVYNRGGFAGWCDGY